MRDINEKEGAMRRLVTLGLVRREGMSYRTSPRFQAAMARAALRLMRLDDAGHDLRMPIAAALVDVLPTAPVDEIATLVEAMLPIESRELRGIL
jgi:hypothetical protein